MPGNDTPQTPTPTDAAREAKDAAREAKDAAREERLAAKLRENLRRRKTQARALGEDGSPPE